MLHNDEWLTAHDLLIHVSLVREEGEGVEEGRKEEGEEAHVSLMKRRRRRRRRRRRCPRVFNEKKKEKKKKRLTCL